MAKVYKFVLHVDIVAIEVNLLTRFDLERTIRDISGHMGVSYEIDLLEDYHENLNRISYLRPYLWSGGQSFWPQIQRPGFSSRHCQIF
jgi:hypothetical protein